MDIVTLGAALNGSAEYVNSHFKGGSNIQIVDNPDGTQTINASGEVSAEDTVARADIAAIKDGESLDSFADVETALGSKQDTISDLSTIRSGAALGATAVQPETGKGLSTNDYTTTEKTKLAGIAEGAEVNVQANWTQTTTTADDYIKNKPTLGTAAALNVAASGNASTSQVVKGNDTRLTDARNAADVSSWAKAANKPSYNGSEIALTGYAEAQSKSSVAATDTANAAIGKLEYRVETNENNISKDESALVELVDDGAKNKFNINGIDTAGSYNWTYSVSAGTLSVSSTGNYGRLSCRVSLPAGSYVFNCNVSDITIAGGTSEIRISSDGSGSPVIVKQAYSAAGGISLSFNLAQDSTIFIMFYVNVSSSNYTNSAKFSDIMVCTKADWDISQAYQPYAMSNAELTEQVDFLSGKMVYSRVGNSSYTSTYTMNKNDFDDSQVGLYLIYIVNWSATPSISIYAMAYSGNVVSQATLSKIFGSDVNISLVQEGGVYTGAVTYTGAGKIQIVAVR